MKRILIVDDEVNLLELIKTIFEEEYEIITTTSGKKAMEIIKENPPFDLVITDLRIIEERGGETSGIDILKTVKDKLPITPVIIITAYSDIESGLKAIELGAFDYVSKPFKVADLREKVKKALAKKENIEIPADLLGNSPAIKEIMHMVQKIKDTPSSVLITGESGVGKEIVARLIHFTSIRRDKPFVPVNCGAIPAELLESELFGYVKGAFTGATYDKIGLFKLADGGTIFLDEVGELPLNLQVKLLRVLQEKKIRPIGALNDEEIDVRVIAATNKNLKEEVEVGKFRQDLYYRLNVIEIDIPPLRERKEDIPVIIQHTLNRLNRELGKEIKGLSPLSEKLLMEYNYPGNIRELVNILERAAIFENSPYITPQHLPPEVKKESKKKALGITFENFNLDLYLEDIEREIILKALEETGGNVTRAAELLGVSFRSLRYRLKKLKIS